MRPVVVVWGSGCGLVRLCIVGIMMGLRRQCQRTRTCNRPGRWSIWMLLFIGFVVAVGVLYVFDGILQQQYQYREPNHDNRANEKKNSQ